MKVVCLHFLFALACSGVIAMPTPDECAALLAPLPLDDRQQLSGRRAFMSGYADHEAFKAILRITDSTRVNISAAAHNDKDLHLYEEMTMNGTCYGTKLNISIDGTVASAKMHNISSVYHLLPTCAGCQVMSLNSTASDLKNFLEAFGIHMDELSNEQMSVRALYLFAEEKEMKDSDLEHFKKQASCLGFSGEPDFTFDPKKGFCDGRNVVMIN
ncbi:uncharacterized protein LOC144036855 [Vanacampus margaritifer]